MRRNGLTSSPANDSAIRRAPARPGRSTAGRAVIAGAAFGLAGLLCLGSPAAAFAEGADPAPSAPVSSTPAPVVTATPAPAAKPAPTGAPTETPTAAPAATPTPSVTPAPTASPESTPTAAPAPAAPPKAPPAAPAAPEAPSATDRQRGGFTELTATNDAVTVASNHTGHFSWAALLANDVNPTGQPVLLTDFSTASHGAIDPTATTTLEYSPSQGFVGKDIIYYSIHDVFGNTNSVPGMIVITVTPNQAPKAAADSFQVTAGKPFTAPAKALLANDTDAEKDTLTVTSPIVLGPDHGTLVMNPGGNGGFTYTPASGYTGYDSFFYRVSDGHGGLSTLGLVELHVANAFVTVKPVIAGTAAVGSTLTAKTGVWGPVPASFQYQWFRDGGPIAGATQKTYTPTIDDVGFTLRAMVIGSAAGYPTVQLTSAATASVALGSFTSTKLPTITGTAKVHATLQANPGTWSPVPGKVSYYWKANGVLIPGADIAKSTLTIAAAQLGKKISVTVYVEKPGYGANHTDSAFTGVVEAATFTSAPVPTITGTTKVGSTLTAHSAAWKPVATVKYQWKRSGVTIAGATSATYKLTSADRGKTVTVLATGTKSGYTTISRSSAPTAAVK